jgi:hypothetical protein
MSAMQKILEDFLNNSTPEQLQAELLKGNRPFYQTLEDPLLGVNEVSFSVPANVSFFTGEFSSEEDVSTSFNTDFPYFACSAENEEFALAG